MKILFSKERAVRDSPTGITQVNRECQGSECSSRERPKVGNENRNVFFHSKRLTSKNSTNAKPPLKIFRNSAFLLNAYIANSWLARAKGVFSYLPLGNEHALILHPCSAIHTVGLKGPIDVAFVNRFGRVLRCVTVRPFSLAVCRDAHSVIEMSGGSIHKLGLSSGQYLYLQEFKPIVPLVPEQALEEQSLNTSHEFSVNKKRLF